MAGHINTIARECPQCFRDKFDAIKRIACGEKT